MDKQKCFAIASEYSSLNEFRRDNRELYREASWLDWFPQLVSSFDSIKEEKSSSKNSRGYSKLNCKDKALLFSYRSDFKKAYSGHYAKARKNGWLDEICMHMPDKRAAYTLEHVTLIAEKYVYYSDFLANEPMYVTYSKNKGWLKEVSVGLLVDDGTLDTHIQPILYDEVIRKARYCKTNAEFNIKHPDHQREARLRGWLVDCYSHFRITQPITKEHCRKICLAYKTRNDISNYAPSFYNKVNSNKWHSYCFAHLPTSSRAYTFEECFQMASLYKTRTEFSMHAPSHYNRARHKNWLDTTCQHMELKVAPTHTYLECLVEARKFSTHKDFRTKASGYYQAALKMGILNEICSYPIKTPPRTKEQCVSIASKFEDEASFKKSMRSVYERAKKQHWLSCCLSAMKKNQTNNAKIIPPAKEASKQKRSKPRIKDECAEIAKSYTSRAEFQRDASSVYQRAYKQGWLDDICSHMITPRVSWTLNDCIKEAKLFSSEKELRNCSPNIYHKAKIEGWLVELDSHYCLKGQSLKDCMDAARTVKSMDELDLEHPRLARLVRIKGWIGKVSGSFIKNKSLTMLDCKLEATKYTSLSEFRTKAPAFYQLSEQNKWLDDICTHMWK